MFLLSFRSSCLCYRKGFFASKRTIAASLDQLILKHDSCLSVVSAKQDKNFAVRWAFSGGLLSSYILQCLPENKNLTGVSQMTMQKPSNGSRRSLALLLCLHCCQDRQFNPISQVFGDLPDAALGIFRQFFSVVMTAVCITCFQKTPCRSCNQRGILRKSAGHRMVLGMHLVLLRSAIL